MSKKSNPVMIGSFVLGAVALVAIAVVVFGGSELLKRKSYYIIYFDGSVSGLKVGSNVLFRGVRVGYVRDILMVVDVDTLEFRTPAIVEIMPDKLTLVREGVRVEGSDAERLSIEGLIAAGLRAQLGSESFVTGQLNVELDFHPDREAIYRGVKVPHPEIPSIPSDIQQVLDNVRTFFSDLGQKIDIDQVLQDVEHAIAGIEEFLNSPDLEQALAGINKLVNSPDTQALPKDLRAAVGEVDATFADARKVINQADGKLEPVFDNVGRAITQLETALLGFTRVTQAAEDQLSKDSELSYQLVKTLGETTKAARSLRILLDYMEQHPESLLKGKGGR
jgi:paraquat-inducible protein B